MSEGRPEGDRIVLRGIAAVGHHGVFEHERRDGQRFVVDVELAVDHGRSGRTDDLRHTVNYADVAAQVVARIEGEAFDLIERLASVVAQDCLGFDLVEGVAVTVHKPEAPVGVELEDVAVSVTRRRAPMPVVIALGANLGDPAATLEEAVLRVVDALDLTDVTLSPWFASAPVGGPEGQPDYVNGVLVGRCRLGAAHMLRLLHAVEEDFGRVREVRWGARTVDLDLVQVGAPGEPSEVRSADPDLTLPHPHAHERAFVLLPWLEADAEARLRVGDEVVAVADLARRADATGVRMLDEEVGR